MQYFHYLLIWLCGAFACNCIPHLAAGLRGERFPTPFAKPRGVGKSSSVVNFVWGFVNLAIAISLGRRGLALTFNALPFISMAGFFVAGTYLSRHFGKVQCSSVSDKA